MDSKYQRYAKRVGFKKKGSLWIDPQGFPTSEAEIKQSYDEIEKIMENGE